MELFIGAIAVGLAFWWGANTGYAAGREYVEEDDGIVNVEVLKDESTNVFFAYEMSTKKFILQTNDEASLPELLTAKYPSSKIVVSRIFL